MIPIWPFPRTRRMSIERAEALLLKARPALSEGRLADALPLLLEAVEIAPTHARSLALLGRSLRLDNQLDAAAHALRQALSFEPEFSAAQIELALLTAQLGDLPAARERLLAIVAREPNNLIALIEASRACEPEALPRARELIQSALRLRPQDAALWAKLGSLAAALADPVAAAAAYTQSLLLRPDDLDIRLDLARCLFAAGDAPAADAQFAAVLRQRRDDIDALEGRVACAIADAATRERMLEQLCASAPNPRRLGWLATLRFNRGDLAGAHIALGRATHEVFAPVHAFGTTLAVALNDVAATGSASTAVIATDALPARWAQWQWPRTPAPESEDERVAAIERWRMGLAEFEALAADPATDDAGLGGCLGTATAFFRHYLDDALNDAFRYGALVERIARRAFSGFPARPLRPSRRRVAVVCAFLDFHTVARLFAPLVANLDSARFEVLVLALDRLDRGNADRLAAAKCQIHRGPRPLPAWQDLLRVMAPDVVLFLEIGMDAMTQALAAQRHAPIQACLWGHPVTTGMSSIDYFLSAQALEPADAQNHYREHLVRLPGFGHGFVAAPAEPSPAGSPRDGEPIELLCTQSVFKLMPVQDQLFARILANNPRARLNLIPHANPEVREWLSRRLGAALLAAGAEPNTQLKLHAPLAFPRFMELARSCALNLDSIGFSGGMTSLDLLSAGVPTLTLPGALMRSRQTAAMLGVLEANELIASAVDDYAERANRLLGDPGARDRCAQRLFELRRRLDSAVETSQALNDFLANATPRAHS